VSRIGRRQVLLALGVMLPGLPARPLLAQARDGSVAALPIRPPQGPMIYTRRLVRDLPGDARIIVERRFAVRFKRSEFGFVVEGEQVAVEVDMPEQLAELARLERERVETGIFPLALDRTGRIRSGESARDTPEIERAMRYAAERIAAANPSQDTAEAMRQFIGAIRQAGATVVSSLPTDLFAPAETDSSATRSIALPSGGRGYVTTRFSAERDPETRLMRTATRKIVTRIDGDERHASEQFSLVPQQPKPA